MLTFDPKTRRAVMVAGLAVAAQVASKAARDGVFLGVLDAAQLPRAIIGAAALSVITVALMSMATRRFGPRRTVPALFLISAALFATEFALLRSSPEIAAVLIFGHVSSLGALLLSGFWALVNDSFDAHSARGSLGVIGTGATFGGLVGGISAERITAFFGVETLLIVLAVTQLVAALLVSKIRSLERTPGSDRTLTVRELLSNRYTAKLALLVVLMASAGGLLDFLLKASAEARFDDPAQITRFFAIFYTGTATLAFILQATVGRKALEQFGLTATAIVLPILVLVGGVAFLLVPGMAAAGFGRGGEMTLRTSLYKSAYELLFAPMSPERRNRLKSWIDVGAERLGDALSGGLVQLLLLFAAAPRLIATSAALLAGAAALVVAQLGRGYVREIEKRLSRTTKDLAEPHTMVTMATMGLGGLDLSKVIRRTPSLESNEPAQTPSDSSISPLAARMSALCSDDANIVRAALAAPLDATLVPMAIELLSRDAVALDASQALADVAEHHTGQLLDTLLDTDEPLSTRRRIPRILAAAASPRVRAGLLEALTDRRFEVRLRAAEALYQIRADGGAASEPLAEDELSKLLAAELDRPRAPRLSESRFELAMADESTQEAPQLYLLFLLLALAHSPSAVSSAYRASLTGDEALRGLSLEYLAHVAPDEVRDRLLSRLDSAPVAPRAPLATLQDSLTASRSAIDAALEARESSD